MRVALTVKHCFTLLVCATLLASAGGNSDAQAPVRENDASALTQKAGGITVGIEKVGIDRVLNEPAYLDDTVVEYRGSSFRFLRVLVSYKGASVKTERITISCANGAEEHIQAGGTISYAPQPWKTRLMGINVDPEARGFERWMHFDKTVDIQGIFPIEVTIIFKLENDKTETFQFNDLEL